MAMESILGNNIGLMFHSIEKEENGRKEGIARFSLHIECIMQEFYSDYVWYPPIPNICAILI